MDPDQIGIQTKANNDSMSSMLSLYTTAICLDIHIMPKLGSSEVCEGPECMACGYGLIRPFQPNGVTSELGDD